MLLLLELHFGSSADLNDGHAASQLGEAFLQFLAVPIGIGFFDLTLDLANPALDLGRVTCTLHDRGVILSDHDLAGRTHHVKAHPI